MLACLASSIDDDEDKVFSMVRLFTCEQWTKLVKL